MIDEKKLIEFLGKISEEYPYKIPGQPDTYSQYNEAWQDCISRAESFVENQAKIGEWIPCSERLPEKVGRYLITAVWKDGEFEKHSVYNAVYESDNLWHGEGYKLVPYKLIAWQPLPEPYKG